MYPKRVINCDLEHYGLSSGMAGTAYLPSMYNQFHKGLPSDTY
jgi:hypothetical protein